MPDAAENAGFRPCKRCRPNGVADGRSIDAEIVHSVCRYIEENYEGEHPVTLTALGEQSRSGGSGWAATDNHYVADGNRGATRRR